MYPCVTHVVLVHKHCLIIGFITLCCVGHLVKHLQRTPAHGCVHNCAEKTMWITLTWTQWFWFAVWCSYKVVSQALLSMQCYWLPEMKECSKNVTEWWCRIEYLSLCIGPSSKREWYVQQLQCDCECYYDCDCDNDCECGVVCQWVTCSKEKKSKYRPAAVSVNFIVTQNTHLFGNLCNGTGCKPLFFTHYSSHCPVLLDRNANLMPM